MMAKVYEPPTPLNPRRVRRHTCCPLAERFLKGYPMKGQGADPAVSWKVMTLAASVPVIYCPWCGINLKGSD